MNYRPAPDVITDKYEAMLPIPKEFIGKQINELSQEQAKELDRIWTHNDKVEPLCRNCRFWQPSEKLEAGYCVSGLASLGTLHDGFAFETMPFFGCVHFEVKDE